MLSVKYKQVTKRSSSVNFGNYILTLPEDITVSFVKNEKMKANFVGKDEENNLGFIRIENPENLPQAVGFDSLSMFNIGDKIYLIEKLPSGYDFENIITEKIINSIIKQPKQKLLINSSLKALSEGGLAVNDAGSPIGILQKSKALHNQNPFEFDIDHPNTGNSLVEVLPAWYFTNLILNPPELTDFIRGVGKSWLGVQMQILKKDMAEYWDLKNTYGIIINHVVSGSPAEKAGLKTGDIITSIGDLEITNDDDKILDIFRHYIRNIPDGDVQINYIRNRKRRTIAIDNLRCMGFLRRSFCCYRCPPNSSATWTMAMKFRAACSV